MNELRRATLAVEPRVHFQLAAGGFLHAIRHRFGDDFAPEVDSAAGDPDCASDRRAVVIEVLQNIGFSHDAQGIAC